MITQTFNSNAQEKEAGRSLGIQGQPGLYSDFQASQGYEVIPCQERWGINQDDVHTKNDPFTLRLFIINL